MHGITPILNGDSNQSGDNDIELSTQAYLKKWKVEWAMSHTELTEHLSNHSASHNSSDSGTKSLSYRQRLRFNTSESQTRPCYWSVCHRKSFTKSWTSKITVSLSHLERHVDTCAKSRFHISIGCVVSLAPLGSISQDRLSSGLRTEI